MADDENPQTAPGEEEEYELLPHKEIEDLKEELSKLKEFEIAPSKRLQVSLLELNTKLDRLMMIFEDATHELRVEEGGLSFTEKMKPLLEKMNKILEQNSEIASGILALADMVKELKEARPEEMSRPAYEVREEAPAPMMAPRPAGMMAPPRAPPVGMMPPGVPPGMPLPPLPRKRTFGI
jgi:hypothetical protein